MAKFISIDLDLGDKISRNICKTYSLRAPALQLDGRLNNRQLRSHLRFSSVKFSRGGGVNGPQLAAVVQTSIDQLASLAMDTRRGRSIVQTAGPVLLDVAPPVRRL